MITKGIVVEVINNYQAKVRLPIFNSIASSKEGTPDSQLNIATICSLPNCNNVVQKEDIVFVGFEDNDISKPIILGHLNRENMGETYSSLDLTNFKTVGTTTLSSDTNIGDVKANEIGCLKGLQGNIQTQLNNTKNLLNNKVDKITTPNQLYGTNSDGLQTTLPYSSDNQNASTIPLRDSRGDVRMNAMYSNNCKIYTKNFYNNNSNMRYCHIGVLKAEYSNQTFAGKIYTSQGYGATDIQQEFIDFTVTINNDEHLRGFATCVYNNFPSQDECQILFVPTSNSWEWDMLLKMHSWTNALIELKMSAPSASDFKFTFDSSDANFVSAPSSTELTITPVNVTVTSSNYTSIKNNSGTSYYQANSAFVIVFLDRDISTTISDQSGVSIDISSDNSNWSVLACAQSINSYPKFNAVSAYIPRNHYFRYNVWGTDNNNYQAYLINNI